MSGSRRSSDGLDSRRRRLLFRAWHRGMRETDLILGSFADVTVEQLSEAEAAEQVRQGNEKAMGRLVGAVMKETKGRADGGTVTKLIRERL